MQCYKFTNEKDKIKDFLNLPKKLYSKETNIEDSKEVEKLLTGTHSLSKYFHLDKFLIYKNNIVVGRFIITTYKNDSTAYLGFFECIDDKKTAKFLFDNVYNFCKDKKYKRIIGPVDASFWIKYRLKINKFDKTPYTGEPYNKSYYQKLFIENNYQVVHHYTSSIYSKVKKDYSNEKYANRYNDFINKGYKIVSPKMEDYETIIKDIYHLITELYSDFPIYKNISQEDFVEVFKNYKRIINPDMIKLAYHQNKMVGFFISIPNYKNTVYHLNNPLNIIKILSIKKKPKEYIMLYMGVDKKHQGLGKALADSIMEELRKTKLPSIGALAKDGKVTQNYVNDLITDRYEYVLLERKIK